MTTRLKICGLTRRADLDACAELGVDAVGINLWPGSRRGLDLDGARALVDGAPGRPMRVGVFVEPTPDEVERAIETLHLHAIQLHDDRDPRSLAALAVTLGVAWVWVVRGTPALDALVLPDPAPAWVLLDAHVPGFGGAGRRTDWAWAAGAARHFAAPVWLAGGITPDNAADAIETVSPAGLDVASGAEATGATRGEKDRDAIAALVRACRGPMV